jgi:hypothetical protein
MDRELVANDDYAEDYPGHVHRVRPIERQSGLVGGYWEEFQPYQKKEEEKKSALSLWQHVKN